MRKSLIFATAAAVASLLAGTPARAVTAFETGNDLLTACQSAQAYDRGRCIAYAIGVADVLGSNEINGFRACLLKGVTTGQVKNIAERFLREHPEKRHLAAASLVAHALANAFPCKL